MVSFITTVIDGRKYTYCDNDLLANNKPEMSTIFFKTDASGCPFWPGEIERTSTLDGLCHALSDFVQAQWGELLISFKNLHF